LRRLGGFLGYAARRFLADGCPLKAGGLGYVSLLAVVPLIAIGLAVLAGFPVFEPWRGQVRDFLLAVLVADAGVEVREQLAVFIANASRMTGPGLAFLALAAILLMANVNGALNAIWRVAEPRPLALRFAVYWAVLTLGPLSIGASLSVSGYAFAAVAWFGVETGAGGLVDLSWLVSFALAATGFALLYFLVPNRAVRAWHALAGGFVAALLFEGLKRGFGLYLEHFPSYEVVYGALAAVPVFLIWLYLAWTAALFGAEIAAAMPEWRAAQARGAAEANPGARLALALSLLARLSAAGRAGVKPKERRLGAGLPATPGEIDGTLRRLRRAGYTARALGGRWVLARDLDAVTLGELAAVLHLGLAPGADWEPAAQRAVEGLAAAAADQMARPLGEIVKELEKWDAGAGQSSRG
ncbi:MAG: YihY family inner membrane protein, partial [Kiloniellales bacterium]